MIETKLHEIFLVFFSCSDNGSGNFYFSRQPHTIKSMFLWLKFLILMRELHLWFHLSGSLINDWYTASTYSAIQLLRTAHYTDQLMDAFHLLRLQYKHTNKYTHEHNMQVFRCGTIKYTVRLIRLESDNSIDPKCIYANYINF